VHKLNQELQEDDVNDLLRALHVRSTVYCRSLLRGPWGFGVQARDACAFHLVCGGSCWLEVDGVDDPMRLGTGDLVLLMTGRGHRLRDEPSSEVEWLDEILRRTPLEHGQLHLGGSGTLTELLCGGFVVEGMRVNPLLLAMPPVLRLDGRDPATSEWLDGLLAMLRSEVGQPRPGSDAVLARLADILLTQAIRAHLVAIAASDRPNLGALRDGRIARAIRLVHGHPGRPWTVECLAAEVAMSRSAFASLFRRLTGESPMRYVTRYRLSRAAAHLGEDGATLLDIALRIGYDSEASFSRHFGMAPGAYRRRLREAADPLGALTR
jgi:AraC-like DNA-binding protein